MLSRGLPPSRPRRPPPGGMSSCVASAGAALTSQGQQALPASPPVTSVPALALIKALTFLPSHSPTNTQQNTSICSQAAWNTHPAFGVRCGLGSRCTQSSVTVWERRPAYAVWVEEGLGGWEGALGRAFTVPVGPPGGLWLSQRVAVQVAAWLRAAVLGLGLSQLPVLMRRETAVTSPPPSVRPFAPLPFSASHARPTCRIDRQKTLV